MRTVWILACVLAAAGCSGAGDQKALEREAEALRAEKARLEAREKALETQLQVEVAQRESALEALEALQAAQAELVPLQERAGAAEKQIGEMQQQQQQPTDRR